MKKAILSVLLLSAVFASPASANYFSNPITNMNLNVGSAPNPTPSQLRLLGESRTIVAENTYVAPPAPPAPPPAPVYEQPVPPAPPAAVYEAPPVAQTAISAREFMVFFDFDRSTLSPEAKEIVAKAVDAAKQTGAVHIVVTGHTDTVGSRRYNQALSERRAMAVKREMVRDGLAGSEIVTVGRNFSEPLIATGPGVREPQNRRASIDLGQPAVAMLEMNDLE